MLIVCAVEDSTTACSQEFCHVSVETDVPVPIYVPILGFVEWMPMMFAFAGYLTRVRKRKRRRNNAERAADSMSPVVRKLATVDPREEKNSLPGRIGPNRPK